MPPCLRPNEACPGNTTTGLGAAPGHIRRTPATRTGFGRVAHAQQDQQAHGRAHDAGGKHAPLPAVHLEARQGGGAGRRGSTPACAAAVLLLRVHHCGCAAPLLQCLPGWGRRSRPCCARCSTCLRPKVGDEKGRHGGNRRGCRQLAVQAKPSAHRSKLLLCSPQYVPRSLAANQEVRMRAQQGAPTPCTAMVHREL